MVPNGGWGVLVREQAMSLANRNVSPVGALPRYARVVPFASPILIFEEVAMICSATTVEQGQIWLGLEARRIASIGSRETWSSLPTDVGENLGVRKVGASPHHQPLQGVIVVTPLPQRLSFPMGFAI